MSTLQIIGLILTYALIFGSLLIWFYVGSGKGVNVGNRGVYREPHKLGGAFKESTHVEINGMRVSPPQDGLFFKAFLKKADSESNIIDFIDFYIVEYEQYLYLHSIVNSFKKNCESGAPVFLFFPWISMAVLLTPIASEKSLFSFSAPWNIIATIFFIFIIPILLLIAALIIRFKIFELPDYVIDKDFYSQNFTRSEHWVFLPKEEEMNGLVVENHAKYLKSIVTAMYNRSAIFSPLNLITFLSAYALLQIVAFVLLMP